LAISFLGLESPEIIGLLRFQKGLSLVTRNLALFLNFLAPGLGSFVLGKWRVGLAQLAMVILALIAFRYSFYSGYAILVMIGAWAWALATAGYSARTGGVKREKA
jgi:hypothetical protein